MNKTELNQAFESMTPTNIQIERIYNKITRIRPKNIYIKAVFATTICIIILFFTGTYFISNTAYVPTKMLITPASDIMPNMRKFMIFNDKRYVFLNNGALYDFDEELTEKLGTLDNEMKFGLEAAAKSNSSSTFAVGSEIYKIPYYDENFRVAVKGEEGFYICQSVDAINDEVDLSEYFKSANIIKNTKNIFVYNHFGNECLGELKNREFKKLIKIITNASEKEFSNEEFEAIAKSQSNGESFKIVLILKDETTFEFYIIPNLSVVMVGDNRYEVSEEFSNDLKEIFKDYRLITTQPLH